MPQREVALSAAECRLPQASLLANGSYVPGVLSMDISQNSYLAAGRYRVVASLDESGYEAWSGNQLELNIRLSFDGNWTSMMLGPVDRIEIDVGQGLVTADGRDRTSLFLEARTQETFENQTASEVATLLAGRRGLNPNVVGTTRLIGRSFGGDYSRVTLDQHSPTTTEWDLLVQLAEVEDFDVWVEGETLNFVPPSSDTASIQVTPADCVSLHLDRCLALCSSLSVMVKSWDCRSLNAVAQTASLGSTAPETPSYIIVRPNLTATAAAALASRTLNEMTLGARVITLEMPGDLTTQPRQSLSLVSTGTDFDGVYSITSVERRLSFERGFTQLVEARMPIWTAS